MNKFLQSKWIATLRRLFARLKQTWFFSWIGRHKRLLGLIIILAFLVFLVYYVSTHHSIIKSLTQTHPAVLGLLLIFYVGSISTQVGIMYATIRICQKKLPLKSGLLLTVYSVVANFFGPLQSGPGIRAVYLRQKIGLRIRDYTYATLFYYFAFGALNLSLLFIGSIPVLSIFGIVLSIFLIIIVSKKLKLGAVLKYIFMIYGITVIQIAFTTLIYFTEINSVHAAAHYSYLQAVIYSASANLSLFVSITPGGIGIREGFILFAQSLHHIPLTTIISAGILDRAFYIVLLGVLFIISSSFHFKELITRKKNA